MRIIRSCWTQEELDYLHDNLGNQPMSVISRKLNRTYYAILEKAIRTNIGTPLKNTEFLTATNVAEMMGVSTTTVIYAYIKKYGLKAMHISIAKSKKYYLIRHKNLMDWLKENQNKFDSRKIDLYALGEEPKWLTEKRKKDIKTRVKNERKRWTKEDEARLVSMYKRNINQKDIAKELNRSLNSIERKLNRLDVWNIRNK